MSKHPSAKRMAPSARTLSASTSVAVSLVRSPPLWQPIDWADEPPGGEIVLTNRFDRPAEAEQWRRTWNEAELEAHNGFWAIVRRLSRPSRVSRPTILSMHLSLHTHGTRLRKRWALRRSRRVGTAHRYG